MKDLNQKDLTSYITTAVIASYKDGYCLITRGSKVSTYPTVLNASVNTPELDTETIRAMYVESKRIASIKPSTKIVKENK